MMTTDQDLSAAARSMIRMDVETYYDVQEVRIQTDHRVRNYAEERALAACVGEAEIERLRNLADKNVAYKKAIRERKAQEHDQFETFAGAFEKALAELVDDEHHKSVNDLMAKQEKIIIGRVGSLIKDHPLWAGWLRNVRGIGPCLAGGIIAWVNIRKATYVGKLWKYCGLAVTTTRFECPDCHKIYAAEDMPSIQQRIEAGFAHEGPRCPEDGKFLRVFGHADRREKGKTLGYNPKLKTLLWKAGESFVKQNAERSGYRRLYEKFRQAIEDKIQANNGFCSKEHKDDKGKVIPCFDAHRYAMAKRATVKIFTSHVYLKWRSILGLPVHDPYAFGMLGHDKGEFIDPIEDPA